MIAIQLPPPTGELSPLQFFTQLELAIDHAKRSYTSLVEEHGAEAPVSIAWSYPKLDLHSRDLDAQEYARVHIDEERYIVPQLVIGID